MRPLTPMNFSIETQLPGSTEYVKVFADIEYANGTAKAHNIFVLFRNLIPITRALTSIEIEVLKTRLAERYEFEKLLGSMAGSGT